MCSQAPATPLPTDVTVTRNTPRFSVIVPVYNDPNGLRECLAALERQTLPKDRFEVIVVDNASAPPIVMPTTPLQLKVVIEARRGSYAARNAGTRASCGEILAFTDADCRPARDWLEQLDLIFDEGERIAAVGGKIEVVASDARKPSELYELVLAPFPQAKMIEISKYAATANMAVRRSAFRAVGEFDSALMSSGDRDWGNRLVAKGLALHYSPRPVVVHPARNSLRALVNKRRRIAGGMIKNKRHISVVPSGNSNDRIHDPRRLIAMSLLTNPTRFGLSRREGAQTLVIAAILLVVRLVEQVRVRLGGSPLR